MKISKIRLKTSALLYELDKNLCILGIIISFTIIIYGVINSKITVLLLGVLLLISCLIWLAIRKNNLLNFRLPESKSWVSFFALCFFILYIISILTVYLRSNLYERPLLYFILTALMAGAIACEILASERHHVGFIFIQVLILGMSITCTQQWITPGLIGIDPWYHFGLTNNILVNGFLPPDYDYSKLPLFHLMIAITSLTTMLPYKLANIVSVSFGQIACNAAFIILIANNLFKEHRIGLLAALLVIIGNLHIHMSYWSIPNSFCAVFIPILLYLLFIRMKNTPQFAVYLLVILIMIAIILTHSIVAFCTALLLFIAWAAFFFYKALYSPISVNISWSIPVGFTIGTFAWWSYITNNLNTLAWFLDHDLSLSPSQSSNIVVGPPTEILFQSLGLYLFLGLSLIGILYMISRKGNISTFSIALVSVTPLCVSFIASNTSSEIIGYRWQYIAQILLSIPFALTLYLIGTWKIRKPVYLYCFFLGFIAALSFLMLMSSFGNDDNHSFIPTIGTSNFYTPSEMVGSDFFAEKSIGILSLGPGFSEYKFMYISGIDRQRLHSIESALNSGQFDTDGSVKIFATRFILEIQRKGLLSSKISPDLNSYLSKSGFNKIYDSSAIIGYIG